MLHKALGDDLGHDLIRVVDALAAVIALRERERSRDVFGVAGGKAFGCVGHSISIGD
jgi:hypothetical protein